MHRTSRRSSLLHETALVDAVGQVLGAADIRGDRIDIDNIELALIGDILQHQVPLLRRDEGQSVAHRRIEGQVTGNVLIA